MPDGLGESLISACLRDRSFNDARDVDGEMLFTPCDEAWEFCLDLIRKKGFPGKEELEARFKLSLNLSITETIESLSRRVKTRSHIGELKPVFEAGLKLISEGDPVAATEKILEAGRLRAKYAPKASRPLSYKSDFEERLVQYRLIKEMGGMIGAATRWKSLNRTIKGWQDGLFHVIAALTSVGKSWFLMVIAEDLLAQRRRPLIVSTEMAPIRLQFRLDCIRYKIPFPLLRDGGLSETEELAYMRRMFDESASLESDAIFVGKHEAKSVQDVQLIARDMGATDVLVDGGYRLTQSREWGDQQVVIQESQQAAEDMHIPWIFTTQLGDSVEKGKSFDRKHQNKWNTRYAKEWLIDPDVVLMLSQPPDLKLVKRMGIEVAKWRDGDGPIVDFQISWDSETMDYHEIEESELVESVVSKIGELSR